MNNYMIFLINTKEIKVMGRIIAQVKITNLFDEDIGILNAKKEGENSDFILREEVF